MNRIETAFRQTRERNQSALVTYVMGGDPTVPGSVTMALACAKGGADILELGMPFSDPMADGPTIQKAAERALAQGTTVTDCLGVAGAVRRKTDAPIALMGYVNPVLAMGLKKFLRAAADTGVDACIFPDLPPEESDDYCRLAKDCGVRTVFLLAPTSTPERCERVFERTTGFIYFVSVTGVTGARTALPADLGEQLQALRKQAPVPVVVGFGIGDPKQVKTLSTHADGVVVGSAIVNRLAGPGTVAARAKQVESFVRSLKAATKTATVSRRPPMVR